MKHSVSRAQYLNLTTAGLRLARLAVTFALILLGTRSVTADVVSIELTDSLLAVAGETPTEVTQDLQAAAASFVATNDNECFERLQVCVRIHSGLPAAEILLATLHTHSGNTQRARELLTQVESNHDRHPAYLLTLARINLSEQRSVEGIALLEMAKRLSQTTSWSPQRKSLFASTCDSELLGTLESQKKWPQIVDLIGQWIDQRSPAVNDKRMRIRYARALFFSGQKDLADRELSREVPSQAAIILAQWCNEVGQRDEAEQLLRQVVRSTNKPMLRITLANYLLDRNKASAARQAINPLMALSAGEPTSIAPGMKQFGIEYANHSAAKDPAIHKEITIIQARMAMLAGDWMAAIQAIEPLYEPMSEDLANANLYARALIASGEPRNVGRGIEIAYSKAAQNDSDARLITTLAFAQTFNNEPKTAMASLMKQAETQEISADAAYILARAIAASGDAATGNTLARRALASDGPFDLRMHAKAWLDPGSVPRSTVETPLATTPMVTPKTTSEMPTEVEPSLFEPLGNYVPPTQTADKLGLPPMKDAIEPAARVAGPAPELTPGLPSEASGSVGDLDTNEVGGFAIDPESLFNGGQGGNE